MKFWTLSTLCTASLLILSGCVSSPIPTEEVKVDSSLPVVSLTQNGIIADMKTVAFEWNSVKDPRVQGIYIYKQSLSADKASQLEKYATVNNRFQTHYLDRDVEPNSKYNYVFRTFSSNAQSLESRVARVTTLPVLASISWIHSITGMPRSSKIIWRPHSNNRVNAYKIERKTLEDEKWTELDTVLGRLNAEYIDDDLNDNYVYMYRIRAVTYDGIVSTPSESVKVVTKALPNMINNIRATKDLPRKIKLDWDASTQNDFAFYHLYRSKNIDSGYELIAKLQDNTYIDQIQEDGKSYFYRVSAIDKDGLESEHEQNSIQGMTLIKPLAPTIVEAKLVGSDIELMWSKADQRAYTYRVEKTQKKGWFDKINQDYSGIRSQHFSDKNVEPGCVYTYLIYSVDNNGIKSEPSIEVKIETPESTEIEHAPVQKVQREVRTAPKTDTTQEIISPMENLDLNEI